MLHLKCLFCYIESDLFAALAAVSALFSLFVLCIFAIFSLNFHANNSKLTVKIQISKSFLNCFSTLATPIKKTIIMVMCMHWALHVQRRLHN